MKLFQINVVANSGSTGRIAEELGTLVISHGWDSYIAYGRWANQSKSTLIHVGNKFDLYSHVVISKLFDRHGLGSKSSTKRLLRIIDEIHPDIIHLHNLHGYYLHYPTLFQYLAHIDIPVVWTLHDCWSMTGHCVHFQNVSCNKRQTQCKNCCNLKGYPNSLLTDNSHHNFILKKRYFNSVNNLTVVSVCSWLDGIVAQSYLKNHRHCVILNGIDIELFKPTKSDIRNKLGINTEKIVLSVANVWNETKGWSDMLKLRKGLPFHVKIVIVGVTKVQQKMLPEGVIGIQHTESISQLVELYSSADVFVNPTYEDTLPTVNIESIACGTPVVTYDTGGCRDIVDTSVGSLVKTGDIKALISEIKSILAQRKESYITNCRRKAVEKFDMHRRFEDYWNLYSKLINSAQNDV